MKNKEIIIIAGLRRSGTSMLMQMLEAGGITPLKDDQKPADRYNPNGYYIYSPLLKKPLSFNFFADMQADQAVKVFAKLLPFIPNQYRYKILFINRDLKEISVSIKVKQRKLQQNLKYWSANYPEMNRLQRVYDKALNWAKKQENIELIELNYENTLKHPLLAAEQIATFINKDLNVDAMTKVVDASLHHIKIDQQFLPVDRSPKEVVHLIEQYAQDKIYCEVGIGEGDNLQLVKGTKKKFGVELSSYGVQRCKEKYPHLQVWLGNILKLFPSIVQFEVCYMWITYPHNREIVNTILEHNDRIIVLMGLNYYYHLDEEDEVYKKYIKIYTEKASAQDWNKNINEHIAELKEKGFDVTIHQVSDNKGSTFSVAIVKKE